MLAPRLALAGAAVIFPVVPRADDVIAVELAVTQRPAHMVAAVGEHAEDAILAGDGNMNVARLHAGDGACAQRLH